VPVCNRFLYSKIKKRNKEKQLKNKLEIYAKFRHGTGYKPAPAREPGVRDEVEMVYFPAPTIGVNFVDRPGGLVLIGQVHGHPPAPQGEVTLRTMSPLDAQSSANTNIPVYGIDAMDGPTRGRPANIHRVTPDGTITRRVGRTSSGFDIGRDAMLIWGRRDLTKQ